MPRRSATLGINVPNYAAGLDPDLRQAAITQFAGEEVSPDVSPLLTAAREEFYDPDDWQIDIERAGAEGYPTDESGRPILYETSQSTGQTRVYQQPGITESPFVPTPITPDQFDFGPPVTNPFSQEQAEILSSGDQLGGQNGPPMRGVGLRSTRAISRFEELGETPQDLVMDTRQWVEEGMPTSEAGVPLITGISPSTGTRVTFDETGASSIEAAPTPEYIAESPITTAIQEREPVESQVVEPIQAGDQFGPPMTNPFSQEQARALDLTRDVVDSPIGGREIFERLSQLPLFQMRPAAKQIERQIADTGRYRPDLPLSLPATPADLPPGSPPPGVRHTPYGATPAPTGYEYERELLDPTVVQARDILAQPMMQPEVPALLGSGLINAPAGQLGAAPLIPDTYRDIMMVEQPVATAGQDSDSALETGPVLGSSPQTTPLSGQFDASTVGLGQGADPNMVELGFALANTPSPLLSLAGNVLLGQQLTAYGNVDDALAAYSDLPGGVATVSDAKGNMYTLTTPELVAEYDLATFGEDYIDSDTTAPMTDEDIDAWADEMENYSSQFMGSLDDDDDSGIGTTFSGGDSWGDSWGDSLGDW